MVAWVVDGANGEFCAGRRYRHIRSGGIYVIVTQALFEATKTAAIVYRSEETGQCWVRAAEEFADGRFALLA